MAVTPSRLRLYRLFQIAACVLGPVLVLVGYLVGLTSQVGAGVAGAGVALFIHGLIATVLLSIETRVIGRGGEEAHHQKAGSGRA
jgi:hypothetical protein